MEAMDVKRGKYRHYKGKEYLVLGVARHSEVMEEFVVYQALYGQQELWIRPRGMFCDKVVANGTEVPRFQYIG